MKRAATEEFLHVHAELLTYRELWTPQPTWRASANLPSDLPSPKVGWQPDFFKEVILCLEMDTEISDN